MTQSLSGHLPDESIIAPELAFEENWNGAAVAELIRSKCAFGETPAFLFLGQKEAALLREHLGQVFGKESVATLRDTYYMGLEVIEIECERFLFAGGRKTVRTYQYPIAKRPEPRDRSTETLWQLRL